MHLFNRKVILILIYSFFTYFFISCSNDKTEEEIKKDIPAVNQEKENIVRTGAINVINLDTDKDGKLYECPMDWNVISDEAGGCPVCEMKLKEFTTSEVKENLVRFGYETVN